MQLGHQRVFNSAKVTLKKKWIQLELRLGIFIYHHFQKEIQKS